MRRFTISRPSPQEPTPLPTPALDRSRTRQHPPFHRPSSHTASRAWLLLLGPIGVLQGSCSSNLFSEDSRINSLLDRQSTTLHGGSLSPARTYEAPESLGIADPALNTRHIPSTNPAASDLTFKVSDEARDVAARLAAFQALPEGDVRQITLTDALRQAQLTGRENLNRQEDYILTAIRLLIERHGWDPRLSNETSATFTGTQTDGNVESVVRILNELQVTQRLPLGGQVAARWVWDATENLRSRATGQYVQSSALVFEGNIPLLRGAGLIAQENLIQAERDLVYSARAYEQFRRQFLVDIANDFFDLLQQQAAIRNSEEQLRSFQAVEEKERALYAAGRKQQLEVNNAANRTLQATSDVANLRDRYVLVLDRFKVRLGLPVGTPVIIVSSGLDLPEPDITLVEAVTLALNYRLDLQNERDRVDDARRAVRNARNGLLPDLNLAANVTLPTDAGAREGGVVYEPDDVRYNAGVTFGLPLDRENERLALRASTIQLQQRARSYEKFRDDLVIDVRQRVRGIELSRFNLKLAEERVKLSERRKFETELKKDEIDTQQKLDALIDLLAAQNARDQAVTDLRNAVLDYLVATGQLRVDRNGELERLPGMDRPTPPTP